MLRVAELNANSRSEGTWTLAAPLRTAGKTIAGSAGRDTSELRASSAWAGATHEAAEATPSAVHRSCQ